MGIYGYTAYTTSKFSLMGLTKALQQEAIVDNIYVSLIFPLETETPGIEARFLNPYFLCFAMNFIISIFELAIDLS